jgi:hypothetical protein
VSARTLVLVSGYARAGKDTLAHGLLEWSRKPSGKVAFADALKDSCNVYLADLGLPGDFHNEEFKVTYRDFLVLAGRFARSLDRDVFARHLAAWVPLMVTNDGQPVQTVVAADWRYLNEYKVARNVLEPLGWTVRAVNIQTAGLVAANDEEAWSIDEILCAGVIDTYLLFKPGSRGAIIEEGRRLAAAWNL